MLHWSLFATERLTITSIRISSSSNLGSPDSLNELDGWLVKKQLSESSDLVPWVNK